MSARLWRTLVAITDSLMVMSPVRSRRVPYNDEPQMSLDIVLKKNCVGLRMSHHRHEPNHQDPPIFSRSVIYHIHNATSSISLSHTMIRSLLLFVLLIAVASAVQPPNMGQYMGQPWYKDFLADDKEIESNRRKKSSDKIKEVSVKARKSAVEKVQSKHSKKEEHGEVNVPSSVCLYVFGSRPFACFGKTCQSSLAMTPVF